MLLVQVGGYPGISYSNSMIFWFHPFPKTTQTISGKGPATHGGGAKIARGPGANFREPSSLLTRIAIEPIRIITTSWYRVILDSIKD